MNNPLARTALRRAAHWLAEELVLYFGWSVVETIGERAVNTVWDRFSGQSAYERGFAQGYAQAEEDAEEGEDDEDE